MKRDIKSADINKFKILGTYEGECADATITNKNGLDITRPVWEGVFASEEYKQAIELGWYIGFLGHPEDPGCQDFEHACIVMTEGHIDNNGKVYGKFNLIDTPVGKIVKAFQDAGVTFGISVRGAGDIIENSVDPDSFTFRGFDLVTFPAFPDAIPTFTEIAASSDIKKQKQYKIVCSTVASNVDKISNIETLNTIESQFAKQSKEYKMIEDRKTVLESNAEVTEEDKVEALMKLYADEVKSNTLLKAENARLRNRLKIAQKDYARKIQATTRIANEQLQRSNKENRRLSHRISILSNTITDVKESNLKYIKREETIKSNIQKQKSTIQDQKSLIDEKDSVIASLQQELNETVDNVADADERTSNLDAKVDKLKKEVMACRKLLTEYQMAYANLYSNAIGGSLDSVTITADTTVKQLNSVIGASTKFTDDSYDDLVEPELVDVSDDSDNDLITL